MRASSVISTMVFGLAAVSIAMPTPIDLARRIVTFGSGNGNGEGSSTTNTIDNSNGQYNASNFNSGKWDPNEYPSGNYTGGAPATHQFNSGQYNKTLYDDSNKFNNGQYDAVAYDGDKNKTDTQGDGGFSIGTSGGCAHQFLFFCW